MFTVTKKSFDFCPLLEYAWEGFDWLLIKAIFNRKNGNIPAFSNNRHNVKLMAKYDWKGNTQYGFIQENDCKSQIRNSFLFLPFGRNSFH